jgi:hypothetical protein
MIPVMNITAWGDVVPWAEQGQIEQDLIISRAIVDLFADPLLREQLRFRGGTALNKLHFPAPLRYSEDIDLVRTTAGAHRSDPRPGARTPGAISNRARSRRNSGFG